MTQTDRQTDPPTERQHLHFIGSFRSQKTNINNLFTQIWSLEPTGDKRAIYLKRSDQNYFHLDKSNVTCEGKEKATKFEIEVIEKVQGEDDWSGRWAFK